MARVRRVFILKACCLAWLLQTSGHASPGEQWYATATLGLREEPHRAASVIATIAEGQALIEITNEGRWIQVGVVGRGMTGWVHAAFIEKVQTSRAALIHPSARFEPALDMFNRVRAKRGRTVFTGAEYMGDGILSITVAAAWFASPYERRQGDTESIYRIWKAANEHRPVAVYISDPQKEHELKVVDPGVPTLHR